ncbi:FKBP12-associated protein [Cryptotrichosporon argae]
MPANCQRTQPRREHPPHRDLSLPARPPLPSSDRRDPLFVVDERSRPSFVSVPSDAPPPPPPASRVVEPAPPVDKPGRRGQQIKQRQKRAVVGHLVNGAENVRDGVGNDDDGTRFTPLDPGARSFVPLEPSGAKPTINGEQDGHERRKKAPKKRGAVGEAGIVTSNGSAAQENRPKASARRAAFDNKAKLSSAKGKSAQEQLDEYRHESKEREYESDDLNARLTRGLSKRPFLECPICFNSITPNQHIWSCLPLTEPPSAPADLGPEETAAFIKACYVSCYTPFHLNCIRDWANRNLTESAEKMEPGQEATWRCPGCQKRRSKKIGRYKCFCGRLTNPAVADHGLPHSCNDACGRPRTTCSHACPLTCHPGPCPPCQVALITPCPSHHTPLNVKCALASASDAALRPLCDETCGRQLTCGTRGHTCDRPCHHGPCDPCEVVETVRCYCGGEEKVAPCGWHQDDERVCLDATGAHRWEGRFQCDKPCGRTFDCGEHTCDEPCHPHPLHPIHCPRSADVVSQCACGQTLLRLLSAPPRESCSDPIPTCGKACNKAHACGHPCGAPCHVGACPPCTQKLVRVCRCGESQAMLSCAEVELAERDGGGVLCERVCKALRNCGKHECGRVCCPLAFKAKHRKRNQTDIYNDIVARADGVDDIHDCPLLCGKVLSCGLHTCQRADHKGACGKCLQASYDELICHCGHTVVYPPVACGTTIDCTYPCARGPPPCGHPKTAHACHEAPDCPPCPYLTTKPCACGKDPAVKHVRCSQMVVSCGKPCGALLPCGGHRCEKPCHALGECGDCHNACGKPKKTCGHACTAPCHAPRKCPEAEACQTVVTQACACGHLQARATCGATATSPSRETAPLKCNSECIIRQRNARLADALGIKATDRKPGSDWDWNDEMRAWAMTNGTFVRTVESKFREFLAGTRQNEILPHMPPSKRQFVFALADAYHLNRDLIDAEPNRSVQIRRRPDSRIPTPLLSSLSAKPAAPPTTGLTNLRAPGGIAGNWRKTAAASASAPVSAHVSRSTTPVSALHAAPLARPAASARVTPASRSPSKTLAPALATGDDDWDRDDPVVAVGEQTLAADRASEMAAGAGPSLAALDASLAGLAVATPVAAEVEMGTDDWDRDE